MTRVIFILVQQTNNLMMTDYEKLSLEWKGIVEIFLGGSNKVTIRTIEHRLIDRLSK